MDLYNDELRGALAGWMMIAGFTTAGALALGVAWVRSLMRVRRLESERSEAAPAQVVAAEVEELRRSLNELGMQFERLAEGQEFLTRIVADRNPGMLQRTKAIEPQVTPH